jgi:hypothetical protein
VPGEQARVLSHGGEVHVGQAGEPVVVVADDRDLAGHVDPPAPQGVEQAEGGSVVPREDGGG